MLMFDNIGIEKNKSYRHEATIFLGDVDIEKILVSKKIDFEKKKL